MQIYEKNKIVRYKARLVTQGFSQRSGFDYDEMYSPVVDVIIFRYFINFAVHKKLNMRLMDVVAAYLYENLKNDIYMKISKRFNMSEACKSNSKSIYFIKLQRSLYGFKQSGRM